MSEKRSNLNPSIFSTEITITITIIVITIESEVVTLQFEITF